MPSKVLVQSENKLAIFLISWRKKHCQTVYIMKTRSKIHSRLTWKTRPAKGTAYPSVNLNQTVDVIKQSKNKARVGQCHWRACCKYWAEVNWEKIRLTGSFPGFVPLLLLALTLQEKTPHPEGIRIRSMSTGYTENYARDFNTAQNQTMEKQLKITL